MIQLIEFIGYEGDYVYECPEKSLVRLVGDLLYVGSNLIATKSYLSGGMTTWWVYEAGRGQFTDIHFKLSDKAK